MVIFLSPLSIDPSRLQQHSASDSVDAPFISAASAPDQTGQEHLWESGRTGGVASILIGENQLGRAYGERGVPFADGRQLTSITTSQHHAIGPPLLPSSITLAELYSASPFGFSTHCRNPSEASSISASSVSASSGGPYKRKHSTRRARVDSAPYFYSHFQDHFPDNRVDELDFGEGRGQVSKAFESLAMVSSNIPSAGGYSRRSSLSKGSWTSYEAGQAEREATGDDLMALHLPELIKEASSEDNGDAGGCEMKRGREIEEDLRCMRQARVQLDSATKKVQDATTISGHDKARNEFVQSWISASYSLDEDGTASRQGVYGSYVKECDARGIRAINAASFGKAIRGKWPQLKTRRLGSRATSRYHYVGMKPAHSAELARMHECDTKGYPSSPSAQSLVQDEAYPLEGEQLGVGSVDPDHFYATPGHYLSNSSPACFAGCPSLIWSPSFASGAPATPTTARTLFTSKDDQSIGQTVSVSDILSYAPFSSSFPHSAVPPPVFDASYAAFSGSTPSAEEIENLSYAQSPGTLLSNGGPAHQEPAYSFPLPYLEIARQGETVGQGASSENDERDLGYEPTAYGHPNC